MAFTINNFLCRYDYLKITDGYNGTAGIYCDEIIGREIFVNGEYAVLTFNSNERDRGKGFRILFEAVRSGTWNRSITCCALNSKVFTKVTIRTEHELQKNLISFLLLSLFLRFTSKVTNIITNEMSM